MSDNKSRGGQKKVDGGAGHQDQHREVHPGQHDHDMREDAQRGQQGNNGGYHDNKPQSTGKADKA